MALRLRKEMKEMDEFSFCMLQGIRTMNLREYAAAMQWFERAIAMKDRGSWWHGVHGSWYLAGAYLNLSDLLRVPVLSNPTKALHAALSAQALLLHDQFGNCELYWERWVISHMKVAAIHHDCDRLDLAEQSYRNAEHQLQRMREFGESASFLMLHRMIQINHSHLLLDRGDVAEALSMLVDQGDPALDPMDASMHLSWLAARCRALSAVMEKYEDEQIAEEMRIKLLRLFNRDFIMLIGDERLSSLMRAGDDLHRNYFPEALPEWVESCIRFEGKFLSPRRSNELRGALLLAIQELEVRALYESEWMPEQRELATVRLKKFQQLLGQLRSYE